MRLLSSNNDLLFRLIVEVEKVQTTNGAVTPTDGYVTLPLLFISLISVDSIGSEDFSLKLEFPVNSDRSTFL